MAAPPLPYPHIPPGPLPPPPPPPPTGGPVLIPVPLPYPHLDVATGDAPGFAAQPAARRDLALLFDGRGLWILRRRGGALGYPALTGGRPGARASVPPGGWWIAPRDVAAARARRRIPILSAAKGGRGAARGFAIIGGGAPGGAGAIDLGAGFDGFAAALSAELGPDRDTRAALETR